MKNILTLAEAYFSCYSYSEYLNGTTSSMEHLQQMNSKFPNSSFLILANYLIGLDNKRDKVTEEGLFLSSKDLKKSLEAFEKACEIFRLCFENETIETENLEDFCSIYYHSLLERAKIYSHLLEIHEESKKPLYLANAIEIYKTIIQDFENETHVLTQILKKKNPYPQLWEESEYGLTQLYLKNHLSKESEEILQNMRMRYDSSNITRGFFLSRVLYEQGMLAFQSMEYQTALILFIYSEEAAHPDYLTSEQMLELWILQSKCQKALGQLDQAMTTLSKVINHDSVSQLRLKAMFLRAEIYELQNRPELAIKQLEATAKKGGEWSIKAKEKLGRVYGYQ